MSVLVLLSLLLCFSSAEAATLQRSGARGVIKSATLPSHAASNDDLDKVKVEIYKMSRCPDAQFIETQLFDAIMDRMHTIAAIQLHFIASVVDYKLVVCKHGKLECAGNKQQLCVQAHAGLDANNYESMWKFIQCQDADPTHIGELELAEQCLADTVEPDLAEMVRECMNGKEGEGLLRGDVEVAKWTGVKKSATIFVEGVKRCVYDGGEFSECNEGHEEQDFVDSICAAYLAKTETWPDVCGDSGEAAKRREAKRGAVVEA